MPELSAVGGIFSRRDHDEVGVVDRSRGGILIGQPAGESLQDRFSRFRKDRQRERVLAKRTARKPAGGFSKEHGERLRIRFVEACMSYLGVPYGQKHHSPQEPEYNAPLFLDCCGLVRRAVRDMEEDFGFVIGKWNQAYMFETLPIELKFEDMKPGDLIFVEGTYYQEGRPPQRHNIVHVEVFIGGDGGEATIGSRWAKSDPAEGKVCGVQIHSSYKYTSTKYEIKRYHFRSLATWLQGTCQSHTYPDAASTSVRADFGGKSVFDEEAESGDDGHRDAFIPDPYRPAPSFYVGEGNNWKVVAEVLERRGWQRLPFDADFTIRFDLKWVEQRGRIDYKRHIEGQLVNHIPNNDILTSKLRFLDTIKLHQERSGERFGYHPASYTSERASDKLAALSEAEGAPDAVWILKPSRGLGGNGIELVRGATALREKLFPQAVDQVVEGSSLRRPLEGWVVQRYVENPLLVQGRKFDIRAYCLVARTTPQLWYFHAGYCKVALETYDMTDLSSRFAHLTNACVQRAHPEYRSRHLGKHIWSEPEVEAELLAGGHWSKEKGPFWPCVHERMKRALVWLYKASHRSLDRRAGFFDLLGVDFMLDTEHRLYLLEMNSNPALFFESSPTLQKLIPALIAGTLDLVLEARRHGAGTSEPPPALDSDFELIADEASGFMYGESEDVGQDIKVNFGVVPEEYVEKCQ